MTTREPAPTLRACAVRVPCSTSNLGAGFDCLGLAFDRYIDAGFEPGGGTLEVQRRGTLRHLPGAVADDVFVQAFVAELARRGAAPDIHGALFISSAIPVGRGLGSSGAAVVAGIALAAEACGATLDRDAALASAVVLEGHPDNAAPALFGGLVAVAYTEHSTPRAMRLPLSSELGFVFAAPDLEISTQRARAALPQQVPHSAAVRNLGRLAALLYGLAHADRAAIATGFNDELHVPYRMPLIPNGATAVNAAVEAGAWAATISGSGSGIVAVGPADREARMLDALRTTLRGGEAFAVRPDPHGAQPRDIVTLRDTLRG
jgi:homoserine kinase